MDKDFFKTYFKLDSIPAYKCPACRKGTLMKVDHFAQSTAASNREMEQGSVEGWWEPENDVQIFRVDLKCGSCQEIIIVIGDGFVEQEHEVDFNGEWERYWVTYYRPQYFWPPLQFINCPPATPDDVCKHLHNAAAQYFSSPASACNSLRMAAEEILNTLGIERSTREKFISLGNRIKKLPNDSNEFALLDAIRWLGNDGSHSDSTLNHDDVESAFTIMDVLVEVLFSDRQRKTIELAGKIRESKGPVRR